MNLSLDPVWRLRVGVAAAVALLWVFLLLELADRVDAAQLRESRALTQVARMQRLSREDEWPAFRDVVNARLATLRERAWRGESEGLLQAQLQDWLTQRLTETGLVQRELAVSLPVPLEHPEDVEVPAEYRLVRARVVFDFQPATFNVLVRALSESPQWVWVERLQVRNWGAPTVELELGALFIIGAPA
jgi:hypothetical protein